MIDATTLLYMVLSAVISAWAFDHYRLYSLNKEVLAASKDATKGSLEMAKQIHRTHNDQAETLAKLGKRVEELSNKIELKNMLRNNAK